MDRDADPTALVVASDPDELQSFGRALERVGLRPELLRDPAAARARLVGSTPDLLVVHHSLPQVEAFRLYTELRGSAAGAATPIVFAGYSYAATEGGGDYYLPRSSDAGEVADFARRILGLPVAPSDIEADDWVPPRAAPARRRPRLLDSILLAGGLVLVLIGVAIAVYRWEALPSPALPATIVPATPTPRPTAAPAVGLSPGGAPGASPSPSPRVPTATPRSGGPSGAGATAASGSVLRGRVLDAATGEAIWTAPVRLVAHGARQPDLVTSTDRSGRFDARIPSGDYTLRVRAAGFRPLERTVEVNGEATGEIVVELLPE